MKDAKKLLLILALVPFLAMQPVETRADGGEDPPHGRPGFQEETVRSRGEDPGPGAAAVESATRESDARATSPGGVWAELATWLGGIF